MDLAHEVLLGTPPVDAYGVFDTGSSFTWLQCLPRQQCNNMDSYPLFNPKGSSSYQYIDCFEIECYVSPGWSCGSSAASDPNLRLYYTRYLDNSTSRGILSKETITLSAENTSRTIKGVLFGCGNDNHANNLPGIVGVGIERVSLVHQLSVSHFSYYVFANGSDIHGVVHFGPGASMTDFGMTTPILHLDRGHYFLNLTGISVDGSDLDFPPGIFEIGVDNEGNARGVIIDTGSTYTLLPSEAFDVFKGAIVGAMYEQGTAVSSHFFAVCYEDVSEAPEVVFQFSGLDYILCNANLWIRLSQLYCLAVLRHREKDSELSIFGFYQQRNVQVGNDMENKLLSLV